MFRVGDFVVIKSGPLKDQTCKTTGTDQSVVEYMYYPQLRDRRVAQSIKFYFKGQRDGYDAADYPYTDYDERTAIPVLPPRVA